MTDRITCCVPFCRRTRRPFEDGFRDWICGGHWRAVPRATVKQPMFDLARKYRRKFGDRSYWQMPPGSPERIEAVRIYGDWWDAWKLCKETAIERAMGLQ